MTPSGRKARIVLTTFGSLGDLHPYLAVAQGLRDRGHDAVVATSGEYRERVESLGLGFRAVRPAGPARHAGVVLAAAPGAGPASALAGPAQGDHPLLGQALAPPAGRPGAAGRPRESAVRGAALALPGAGPVLPAAGPAPA